MKLEDSPFQPGWWGTSLANIGLEAQRPNVGTYGRYEQTNLPALPVPLDGSFAWLLDSEVHAGHIGLEREADNSDARPRLEEACRASGVALPAAFLKFFATPGLHRHIRSNTDSFLDLAAEPVASPVGEGVLIRFLADSQGCVFWYLFVPTGVNDHAVVSSSQFYGSPEEMYDEDEMAEPGEIVFCEQSFEAFMCRFWIENELWFSEYDGTPITEIGRQYLAAYSISPPDPLAD